MRSPRGGGLSVGQLWRSSTGGFGSFSHLRRGSSNDRDVSKGNLRGPVLNAPFIATTNVPTLQSHHSQRTCSGTMASAVLTPIPGGRHEPLGPPCCRRSRGAKSSCPPGTTAASTRGDGRHYLQDQCRSAACSQPAEERHQLIIRPIASGPHIGRHHLVQHTLLERQIGIEVNLSGLQRFVA